MKATPVIFNGMLFTHGFGMPQNDFGNQVMIPAFEEGLLKFDTNQDGLVDKAELPKEEPYSQVNNIDLKEGGRLDLDEWNYFRASLASVNAILGIRLGGSGDIQAISDLKEECYATPAIADGRL